MLFVAKTVNHKGQADEVIEFLKSDSPLAQDINKTYAVIKEVERPKYLPSEVVRKMKDEGFPTFTIAKHAELWRELDAKGPSKGYGVQIAKTWYWYEQWVEVVRTHCKRTAT